MKKLFTWIFTLIYTSVFCQGIDTVIDKGIYKSYYDIDIKEPIYLSYKLYKGGGKCSREGFRFKNDTKIATLFYKKIMYSCWHELSLIKISSCFITM